MVGRAPRKDTDYRRPEISHTCHFSFVQHGFQKSDTRYGRHLYFRKNYSHRILNNHGRHATKADTNVTQLCFSNSDSYRPFKIPAQL